MVNTTSKGSSNAHPAEVANWIIGSIGVIVAGAWAFYTYVVPANPFSWIPGIWSSVPLEMNRDFGDPKGCQFNLKLSNVNLNSLVDKNEKLTTSNLSFIYNEQAVTAGCKSGIAPNTIKELKLGQFTFEADRVNISYTDTTGIKPRVVANLSGKFDRSANPAVFKGKLQIERIDEDKNFNWQVEQSVDLKKR